MDIISPNRTRPRVLTAPHGTKSPPVALRGVSRPEIAPQRPLGGACPALWLPGPTFHESLVAAPDPRQDFLLRGLHTVFEIISALLKPLFAAVLFGVELQFGGLLLRCAGAKHPHRQGRDASEAMPEELAGDCLMIADANVGTAPSERLRRKRSHI